METRPSSRLQRWNLSWTLLVLFFIMNASLRCYGSYPNEGAYMTMFNPVRNGSLPSSSFVMPTLFWEPRNPIFNCPGKGVNTVNLRLNDYLRLACPKPGRFISWHNSLNVAHNEMYENAFITNNETAMNHCTANSTFPFLMECNDPVGKNIYRTFRIAQHSGNEKDPLFDYNRTYYLFGTATGFLSGLSNRVGGRCSSSGGDKFQMKLKLRVCANGEAGTAKCPICMDSACYNYGCGTYSEWKETNKYQRVDNICHIVHERTCDYVGGTCDGPSAKLVPTKISNCIEPVAIPDYNFTNSYVMQNGRCNAVFKRTCAQDTKGVIVSKCVEDMKYVQVDEVFCGKRATAESRCGEGTNAVSMLVSIFIVIIIAIVASSLLIGIFLGTLYAKKKATVASTHRHSSEVPGKDRLV